MSESKVAIVTGAAAGIGLGIATRLAKLGHRVAMLDREEDQVFEAAQVLKLEGYQVLALAADVAKRPQIDAAYAVVREQWGPIGIVVANAGISGTSPFHTMSQETWQRMIDINLTGVFNTVQAGVPDMIDAHWGRVITISSQAGQAAAPLRSHYSAAKGGVIAFTRSIASDLGHFGITVNTIPPSMVATPLMEREKITGEAPPIEEIAPMLPIPRVGMPEDIADACEFLISDKASYITGQQINVNGGAYM